MFSKYSRYRKLPDEVTTDPRRRTLASKQLRLTPDVEGTFLHTVEEGDRLDHLAYKYYRRTRSWWRICDADAERLSPQALVGREPLATVRIPVTWEGFTPPWSDLLKTVADAYGVDAAHFGHDALPAQTFDEGEAVFDIDPALVTDLDAAVHTQTPGPALTVALNDGGIVLSDDLAIITERPDDDLWRITDRAESTVHTLRFFEEEGLLNVYAATVQYDWTLTVLFNEVNTAPDTLAGLAESLGFVADTPVTIERAGKKVIIPSRTFS